MFELQTLSKDAIPKALNSYEKALSTCSPGNQDAILRWNTWARILMQNSNTVPAQNESGEQMLE